MSTTNFNKKQAAESAKYDETHLTLIELIDSRSTMGGVTYSTTYVRNRPATTQEDLSGHIDYIFDEITKVVATRNTTMRWAGEVVNTREVLIQLKCQHHKKFRTATVQSRAADSKCDFYSFLQTDTHKWYFITKDKLYQQPSQVFDNPDFTNQPFRYWEFTAIFNHCLAMCPATLSTLRLYYPRGGSI